VILHDSCPSVAERQHDVTRPDSSIPVLASIATTYKKAMGVSTRPYLYLLVLLRPIGLHRTAPSVPKSQRAQIVLYRTPHRSAQQTIPYNPPLPYRVKDNGLTGDHRGSHGYRNSRHKKARYHAGSGNRRYYLATTCHVSGRFGSPCGALPRKSKGGRSAIRSRGCALRDSSLCAS